MIVRASTFFPTTVVHRVAGLRIISEGMLTFDAVLRATMASAIRTEVLRIPAPWKAVLRTSLARDASEATPASGSHDDAHQCEICLGILFGEGCEQVPFATDNNHALESAAMLCQVNREIEE